MRNFFRLFILPFAIIGICANLSACVTTNVPPPDLQMMAGLQPASVQPIPSQYDYSGMSIPDKNIAILQQALPVYENAVVHPWSMIPNDTTLKPGDKNTAILALRERLKATGELTIENDSGSLYFDNNLSLAVKTFQMNHGLDPDGIVGPNTFDELNISPEQRLNQIKVNLTRWSKLSQELKDNHYILVNVPAYRLDLVENNRSILNMRAIVGKPERPTPEIDSTVTRIVLNPYWNVPNLIAQNDIVPKVIENPEYLDNSHIKVFNRQDENATEIASQDVDWQSVEINGFPYHLRQDPGTDNALGVIKFEFQNSADIYMHDTPAKNLFEADKRDFSSGCIRLEKPFDLMSYLMEGDNKWTEESLQSTLSDGTTRYIKVTHPTQVVITYITSFADDNGVIQFRDDIYGLDQVNPVS